MHAIILVILALMTWGCGSVSHSGTQPVEGTQRARAGAEDGNSESGDALGGRRDGTESEEDSDNDGGPEEDNQGTDDSGSQDPGNDVVIPDTNPDETSQASGGAGGPTGQVEQSYSASNGKTSTYKTVIPADIGPGKTYGLSIHLHGDGGGDYDWLFEPNVRIAARHGLIGVVVMAPNAERRWYRDGENNARFLDELIQKEFFGKYNIDKSKVYFSGVSGGSQFLTGQFIPLFGSRYNSGALLLCGGPANWQDTFNSTPEFIKAFKLYWYSSTGDFLYDQIEEGITYYKGKGMQVDSEIMPGGSHCDFPGGVSGALESKLPQILH